MYIFDVIMLGLFNVYVIARKINRCDRRIIQVKPWILKLRSFEKSFILTSQYNHKGHNQIDQIQINVYYRLKH